MLTILKDYGIEELSLLPVEAELLWQRGPFLQLASLIVAEQQLPHWKIEEISKTLQLTFNVLCDSGMRPEEALNELNVKFGGKSS